MLNTKLHPSPQTEEVVGSRVRPRFRVTAAHKLEYGRDEVVEVFGRHNPTRPEAWSTATIRSCKCTVLWDNCRQILLCFL